MQPLITARVGEKKDRGGADPCKGGFSPLCIPLSGLDFFFYLLRGLHFTDLILLLLLLLLLLCAFLSAAGCCAAGTRGTGGGRKGEPTRGRFIFDLLFLQLVF